ncbi:TPA: hypothetical protein HA344_04250 [Candidatus Bathyarchaeota archaeon]|nr:hypothetical protein [Candidatus Bathyarchaeota archaeon]
MKILLYFDWVGSRKELREHDKRLQNASKEVGVEYMGIHGSMNQKWNFCWIFSARSYDHFMEMTAKVPRPPQMTHYATELLIPVKLPNDEPSL